MPLDDVVHVWWYNNESIIQSHGINFVQDLPQCLVLLLCFEHFTPKYWGIILNFKFTGQETDKCLLSLSLSPPLSAVDIVIDLTNKIQDHFRIVGHADTPLPSLALENNIHHISDLPISCQLLQHHIATSLT